MLRHEGRGFRRRLCRPDGAKQSWGLSFPGLPPWASMFRFRHSVALFLRRFVAPLSRRASSATVVVVSEPPDSWGGFGAPGRPYPPLEEVGHTALTPTLSRRGRGGLGQNPTLMACSVRNGRGRSLGRTLRRDSGSRCCRARRRCRRRCRIARTYRRCTGRGCCTGQRRR